MTMELRVGNKYRLGRKIGSGSFGDIYLGEFLLFSNSCFVLSILLFFIVKVFTDWLLLCIS